MDLRHHIISETSALAERLIAVSDTELKQTRQEASESIERLQQELASVRDALQVEATRVEELAGRLDAEADHTANLAGQLDAETLRAATLTAQLDAETARAARLNLALEAESLRANALAAQLETEGARSTALATELQTATIRVDALASELDAAKLAAAALLDSDAAQRQAIIAAEATTRELRGQLAQQSASIAASDGRAQAAEEARARMQRERGEAQTIADAASAEMSALTRRVAGMLALLNGAAASLVTLSNARTTADLFTTLVRELATQFERVAIFRVKGNHLEGEHAAGLDDQIEIHKIVVPMGLSSVMTKAATSGTIEHAAEDETGEARPPFGGSPAAALAAPLVFDGEVLAVVYLESDAKLTDAHGPLAAVLVRHANAVLAGLAQELRTSRHLREYARTLLQEAEAMFDADAQSGARAEDRLARLRDSIRFARDLYAQRAALEAPLSMNLLDDEIGRTLRESSSPFIAGLAAMHEELEAPRSAASA